MRKLPHLQVRIKDLMAIVVVVALALVLIPWMRGLLAVIIVVIPGSLLFELIFGTPPPGSLRLSPESSSTRSFLTLMAIVALLVWALSPIPWLGPTLLLAEVAISFGLLAERGPSAPSSHVSGLEIVRDIVILTVCVSTCTLLSGHRSSPTILSPLPLLVAVPILCASSLLEWTQPSWVIPPLMIGTFLLLNLYQLRASTLDFLPMRFTFLTALATAASVLWFIGGWKYGVRYQGLRYTAATASINLLCLAAIWGCWIAVRKRPSKGGAFAFAALLHGWLFSFALPWLGELP